MRSFEQLGNTRVLIVDDQKDIHDDFREMLQGGDPLASEELSSAFGVSSGEFALPAFELLHAASGEEACEIVGTARARDEPVAVAFVDVRMPPGIDGRGDGSPDASRRPRGRGHPHDGVHGQAAGRTSSRTWNCSTSFCTSGSRSPGRKSSR